MNRREFLRLAGASVISGASVFSSGCSPLGERNVPSSTSASKTTAGAVIFPLRIARVKLEISPNQIIQTVGYNGSVPGPLLRVKEGQQVTVDVHNDSDVPELVHWHGLYVPSEVDGAMEEGTLMVTPGASRQYSFVAQPSGSRCITLMRLPAKTCAAAFILGSLAFFTLSPRTILVTTTRKFLLQHGTGIQCS
jgi:FtsP/CotA-like multicopper oxidase with cupredoxin domain